MIGANFRVTSFSLESINGVTIDSLKDPLDEKTGYIIALGLSWATPHEIIEHRNVVY